MTELSETPDPERPRSPGEALARAHALLAPRWLNSPPLLLATQVEGGEAHLHFIHPGLAERAVLLQFWDFTCFHCLRTLPYMRAWHERYVALGLTVVGIHTPKFSFGGQRSHVERAVRDLGIRYPVVIDADYTIWRSLSGEHWPRAVLFDPNGQAMFDHAGDGDYPALEIKLQETLRQGRRELALPAPIGPVRIADAPHAVLTPTTPEIYCGFLRGVVGNSEGMDTDGGVIDYPDETRRLTGQLYLSGSWRASRESLRSAPSTDRPSALRMRCEAAGVNAVLRGVGGAATARVTIDGVSVPDARRGADIAVGTGGETTVLADEPRMYQLFGCREHRKVELTIEVASGELEVFALSFARAVEPRLRAAL